LGIAKTSYPEFDETWGGTVLQWVIPPAHKSLLAERKVPFLSALTQDYGIPYNPPQEGFLLFSP
jgi:hypothetical protein